MLVVVVVAGRESYGVYRAAGLKPTQEEAQRTAVPLVALAAVVQAGGEGRVARPPSCQHWRPAAAWQVRWEG